MRTSSSFSHCASRKTSCLLLYIFRLCKCLIPAAWAMVEHSMAERRAPSFPSAFVRTEAIAQPHTGHGIPFCKCFQDKKIIEPGKRMLQRILFRFLYKIKETLIYHQQDIQLSAFFQDPFLKPVGISMPVGLLGLHKKAISSPLEDIQICFTEHKTVIFRQHVIFQLTASAGQSLSVFRK